MVATTRSRSSPSRTRTLRPRFSKPTDEGRAASAAASAKKEKSEDILIKKRTSACDVRNNSANDGAFVKSESFVLEDHGIEQLDIVFHRGDRELKNAQESPFSTAGYDYESLRLQRIAENKARLAALGVQKHAETLTSFFRVSKAAKRPWKKPSATPVEPQRRSERLKNNCPSPGLYTNPSSDSDLDTSEDTIVKSAKRRLVCKGRVYRNYVDEETPRPANAPLPKKCPENLQVSPILSALRCRSKERGTLYDSIVGICCHFCRQKKLCGEEDCERCGLRDVTKTCLGKTDCSKCHSSTGVFCRACLKIRYGEETEDVRQRTDWLCPHCSEEQGLNPYWICNSSICLSRRKIAPTGIAIYKARELGYKSVAHYLADLLEKGATI